LDINVLGYIIVGLFVATWAIALSVWHFGKIEQRWPTHRDDSCSRGGPPASRT
jgi:high-affinity nickel-transport protein